jgi:hypothetical protein
MPDDTDNYDKITKALERLAGTHVMVGIPAANDHRSDSAPSNATLGYIHEVGSPANNIPARPFLVPGVRSSEREWTKYMVQAGQAAFRGDEGVLDRALNAAGQTAVTAVKKTIVAGIPPPLKPGTVAARARHKGDAAFNQAYRQWHANYRPGHTEVTSGGVTPLIDTAQLINSITYVVKKRPAPP